MDDDFIFTNNPSPIWIYDSQSWQFLNVNGAAISKYGYSKKQFLQMQVTDLYHAEYQPILLDIIRNHHNQLSFNFQCQHRCCDGKYIDVEIFTYSIEYQKKNAHLVYIQDVSREKKIKHHLLAADFPTPVQDGRLLKTSWTNCQMIAICQDITNYKQTEQALKTQLAREQLMRTVVQRIHQSLNLQDILNATVQEVRHLLQVERVIVYQFAPDKSGKVVAESVEAGWRESLGVQIEDTCFQSGAGVDYYYGRKRAIANIYTAGLTDCHIRLLEQFEVKANLVVPILVEVGGNNTSSRLWGLLVAHQCSRTRQWEDNQLDLLDQLSVTIAIAIQQSSIFQQAQTELAERQKAESELRSALAEKEILLKEVHHRVKNNLQIVSSLLELQSQTLIDPEVIRVFQDSQNRIDSISLIHKNLYTSPNIGQLDVVDYIQSLATSILISYQNGLERIELKTDISPISLNIDQAIACGLILNELISNSLKHAFPKDQKGIITITLEKNHHHIKMSIQDNGVGIPNDLDWRNSNSLGLSLVSDLVTEQLEGSITLERNHGTVFTIQFPQFTLE
ncbi:GAF domain-containing protein [Nostoc sp. FACHB-87]|uniref:PAS domain-containing sensor histidine kinase n=1 Tax=Nostocaceae TaxID=1162 RepID=UPI0016855491|nr:MULTISPECIES: histidine kinase dimerization/phosphoacceptor domain -containing protein [Nostocaceae]MBD2453397.1 GAF domain-containing protein [Nostoc sp. FACHB-87]MBD2475522.1 GAF domain-containing protein [Anabaena sp. FACHB-83]